jgi:ABC-type uncharacterized transport system auxiliary subunit
MKKVYLLLLSLITLMSCISFKSEYPVINYYNLTQETSLINSKINIDGVLQIRDVSASDIFDTDQISAVWDNKTVEKYFYHRWGSDVPAMVSDFLFKRFTDMKIFNGGVVKSTSMMNPDYIIEAKVTDMTAYNYNDKGENCVTVSVHLNLIKRENDSPGKVILSDVFTSKKTRKDNLASSMAPAFSLAMSEITDKIMAAMETNINKEVLIQK